MGLQFSDCGPEFPESLLEELLSGQVVFLCGAGVSAPQLPGFNALTENIYADLGLEVEPAEARAISERRFEEALGTLSRRLANPSLLYDAVAKLLRVPRNVSLKRHETILRLSRRLDNRPTLVTTNFDTLFERAVERFSSPFDFSSSVSVQELPAPGTAEFSGIIHLHGRLPDQRLYLSRTPLVLTSAEYGEAYMRAGWAARFLFDLARCRTVVLVGYSAGDAPVRYLLNVLGADRDRFTDICPVYALVGAPETNPSAARDWEALAVTPLAYRVTRDANGHDDHGHLWNDLESLADLVERPKSFKRDSVLNIMRRPLGEASDRDRARIEWSLRSRRQLMPLVASTALDPLWITHLIEQKVWSKPDLAWVASKWFAYDWQHVQRFEAAIDWSRQLGDALGSNTTFWLDHPQQDHSALTPLWNKAWRFFSQSVEQPPTKVLDRYRLAQTLQSGQALDTDIQAAVASITPRLKLDKRWSLRKLKGPRKVRRLSDICNTSLEVSEGYWHELSDALLANSETASRTLTLATAQLRSSLVLARECERIDGKMDLDEFDVPALEDHQQTRFRHGIFPLARLMAAALEAIAPIDPDTGREIADQWRRMGFRLSTRLWINAARRPELFDATARAQVLLGLGFSDFWFIKREWVLLARTLATTPQPLIDQLCERILRERRHLYRGRRQPKESPDWIPFARDRAAWLRLSALDEVCTLSVDGAAVLAQLKQQHSFLNRALEEQDLFSVWTSEVRSVSPDPTPIINAKPSRRLEVAKKLQASPNIDARNGWSGFCAADPQGALASLRSVKLRARDADLWQTLLYALLARARDENGRALAKLLLAETFKTLSAATKAFLRVVKNPMVEALSAAIELKVSLKADWWDKLWDIARDHQENELGKYDNFYGEAINAPAGRLAEILLNQIDRSRKAKRSINASDKTRLARVLKDKSRGGSLALCICTRNLSFLLAVDEKLAAKYIFPALRAKSERGRALRAVLAEFGSVPASSIATLKDVIFLAARESNSSSISASNVAALVLIPVLRTIEKPKSPSLGISAHEARRILASCRDGVREGALICFKGWMGQFGDNRAQTWHRVIGPLFEKTWPLDKRFKREAFSDNLVELAISTAGAFPNALKKVRHFLLPVSSDFTNLHHIASSTIPTDYPEDTLDLLWLMCGPPAHSTWYDLDKALDKITAAMPKLEFDRRLQWLEEQVSRN